MPEFPPPHEPRRSKLPLILTVLGIVGALIGIGRCGAFGRDVKDYGASGALVLILSGVVLITATILYVRSRN